MYMSVSNVYVAADVKIRLKMVRRAPGKDLKVLQEKEVADVHIKKEIEEDKSQTTWH